MLRLIRLVTLPYFRRHLIKIFLTLLGMAIGVAVFTAIDLSNRSVIQGLESSLSEVSINSQLILSGKKVFLNQSDFLLATRLPGVRAASPLLESKVTCPNSPQNSFPLLGIDLMSRSEFFPVEKNSDRAGSDAFLEMTAVPNTLLLTEGIAQACKIDDNSMTLLQIEGKPVEVRTRIFKNSGGFEGAFADIATAQELFGKNELSRIEILLDTKDAKNWLDRQSSNFLPNWKFTVKKSERPEGEDILRGFQLNLLALGGVSLFVSIFIVYNASGFSVIFRRRDIGMLRALGASRGRIATLFLVETLLFGIIGSAFGLLLGWGISKLIFHSILTTVQDLYLSNAAGAIQWHWKTALIGFGSGLAAALFGAAVPIMEATRTAPIEAIRPAGYERRFRHHPLFLSALSLLSATFATISYFLASVEQPEWSFVTAFGALLAFLFLTPLVIQYCLKPLRSLAGRCGWGSAQVALSHILENPYRFAVVTAAFSLGVALWLGVDLMVHSFRETVVQWVETTTRGDLYLTFSENGRGHFSSFIPENFQKEIEQIDGIERIDSLYGFSGKHDGSEISVYAVALKDLMAHGQFQFISGDKETFLKPHASVLAAVAESTARRQELKVGDDLRLKTKWGDWIVKVGAILYDYTSERGVVYVDREDFEKFSKESRKHAIALYLQSGKNPEQIRAQLLASPSRPPSLQIQLNGMLKERILNIFDQTFKTTQGLKFVALLVAFMGILSSLITVLEEKRREIGLLQAIGMGPNELLRYGLSQGLALAGVGVFLGSLSGYFLCWVILKVVHLNYFGWTLFLYSDPWLIVRNGIFTLAVGVAATLYPIHLLRKMSPSAALRFEE